MKAESDTLTRSGREKKGEAAVMAPPRGRVVLLNDDTPMGVVMDVVAVLAHAFRLP